MKHFSRIFYAYTNLVPTDLYPVQYGEEQCESRHEFGPYVRSNYLIHYVYSGKGTLKNDKGEYSIGEGEMFLISPGELTYYVADKDEPWHYAWVEFNGSLVMHILKKTGFAESAVCKDMHNAGAAMKKIAECNENDFVSLIQCLWGFLGEIADKEKMAEAREHEYIKKAESYIKINLHKKTTVTDVAAYVGIDRSHLSRLFSEYIGVSPQQYILSLKMNTAANYLKDTNINISEAAQSVGYSDTRVFNRAFKKHFGLSPSAWRKKPR